MYNWHVHRCLYYGLQKSFIFVPCNTKLDVHVKINTKLKQVIITIACHLFTVIQSTSKESRNPVEAYIFLIIKRSRNINSRDLLILIPEVRQPHNYNTPKQYFRPTNIAITLPKKRGQTSVTGPPNPNPPLPHQGFHAQTQPSRHCCQLSRSIFRLRI